MRNVIILLSANYDSLSHLERARRRLLQVLFDVSFTPSIWTAPYHSPLPLLYQNQLVYAHTSLPLEDLQMLLKHIEQQLGRTKEEKERGIVRIDIDLMQYGDTRHHLADWERPYMKQLLEEQPQTLL